MHAPVKQPLSDEAAPSRWTARAVGDVSQVPAHVHDRSVPATVPGCIHTDLMDAGLIPDPAIGDNEKHVQWVSWTDWRYEREFEAGQALFEHHEIDLVFECLDTIATVELNGAVVGHAASEFIPHRFSVMGLLKPGTNTLAVTFKSPLRHIEEEAKRLGPRPVNGDWSPYNMIRKCASNFGWDWGPKVATCGITQEARLEGWSTARIAHISPEIRHAHSAEWQVDVAVHLHASQSGIGRNLAIRGLIHSPMPSGDPTSLTFPIAQSKPGTVQLEFIVEHVELWRPALEPRGMYTLDIDVFDCQDESGPFCSVSNPLAFRTVDLSHETCFVFQMGSNRVLAQGANWIPEGLWPRDRTPERIRHRLQQMVDAGMNMIRVWGGGRYEPDWFYDICDELGLMVWQDFMFSCACYPEEEPLRSLIEAEARHQVARLSRHPCIVLWCGGNECHWAHESWGFKEKLQPGQTWGRHYWQEMLPRIVRELDPSRPYWPDSPWSGDEKIHPNDPGHGDRHTWDVWGEGYRTMTPRFCSEFGQQSPSNYSTLAKAGLVTPEPGEIVPRALAARQLGPGGPNQSGMQRWYDEPMKAWFREPKTFDEWHYLAQLLQARSLAIGIEWMRANSDTCSGALVWQLNDAWPGLSWSLVDSEGRKKPAWYAVRRAIQKENPSREPEPAEQLVEHPRIDGALVCRGSKQKLILRAVDTVKDIVVALDRLHPEGELEDQCFTLRAGETRQLAITSPVEFAIEQIMASPVFMCSNGFQRGS